MSIMQLAAIFPETPPAAALPSSRGAASAPVSPEGESFAQVLQGKWRSGPEAGAAETAGSAGRSQGEGGKAGSATRDSLAAEARSAAPADPASPGKEAAPTAATDAAPATPETAGTQETAGTAGKSADGKSNSSQAIPAFSGGVGASLGYLKRNSLAAEARRVTAGETIQPESEAATATATSASAGKPSLPAQAGSSEAERETKDSDLERDSLAAEAQRTVPVVTLAQLAAAGAATGYFGMAGIGRGNGGSGAQGDPVPLQGQEAAWAAAGQLTGEPAQPGADPRLAATGAENGAVVPAPAGTAEQQGVPVPAGGTETGAGADGFAATPVAGSASQPTPATAAARQGAQAGQVSAALPGAGERHPPQPGSQLGGVSVLMRETGEQQEQGAAEGVPQETAAFGALGEAPASAGPEAGRQSAQVETAQPDAAPVAGFGARLAERRESRHQSARGEGGEAALPEQAGSAQKALGEEGLGIKTAAASQAEKPAGPHGGSGQYGAAEPTGSGPAEAKPAGAEAGPAQAAALGTQGSGAGATQHAEAQAAHPRGALHESILAQVKDGVVSHDGKGNGEMSIRLNPGELGELKIQVRMEDNRLRVEVQADSRMVKDLLMSNLDSLKEALSGKNFTMEGFDVSTGGGFNSPLSEERDNSRQQQAFRPARAGGYGVQEERRVNYLTADVNSLLDVRF